MFIVFRASGADFDRQGFAATYKLEHCSFWLRGQPRRPGIPAPNTSGFRFSLPDAETSADVMLLIRAFLKDGVDWLHVLKEQGVYCEIYVGLTVGSEAAFTACVTFDPFFLSEIADHRIGLVCTAYPSSD